MVTIADFDPNPNTDPNMIPPPRAQFADETPREYDAAVGMHVIGHIRQMPEFAPCAALLGSGGRGGSRALLHFAKARRKAEAIAARIPPLEAADFNTEWVLRLASAVATEAWRIIDLKGKKKKKAPVPKSAPAAAHSVAGPAAGGRARLASGPYDRTKRPARRSAEDDELAALMSRATLADVERQVEQTALPPDDLEVLCSALGNTHIAPPAPAPVAVAAVPPVFAIPGAPVPEVFAVPFVAIPEVPPPSAPRRATVELPDVDTAPVYYAPAAAAVATEPLIYVPCARKARAPAQARSPYCKADRPAHRKLAKLAPPPEVPYIEAVTETLSGEHLFTEVHILDGRPLRDGRLARRAQWRRVAVA